MVVIYSLTLGGVRLRRSSGKSFNSLYHISADLHFKELMSFNSVLTFGPKALLFFAKRVLSERWLFDLLI